VIYVVDNLYRWREGRACDIWQGELYNATVTRLCAGKLKNDRLSHPSRLATKSSSSYI